MHDTEDKLATGEGCPAPANPVVERRRLRPRHWVVGVLMAMALIAFGVMLMRSLRYAESRVVPRLERLDAPATP